MASNQVSIAKYLGYFSLIYAAILTLTNVLQITFEFDPGAAINVVILIAAAYGAAAKFVMDNNRPPEKQEKNRLIWGCFFASVIIMFADIVIVMLLVDGMIGLEELFKAFGQLPATWWLVIIAVTIIVEYLCLFLVFGWGARNLHQQFQRQAAKRNAG